MPSIIELILAALATYRVARMIAMEDGAFDIFVRIREKLGVDEQANWIARGISCPLCVGFWVALVFALLLAHQVPTMYRSEILLTWLGIAGAATIIQLVIG